MICLRFEFQLHPEGREVSGTKVSTLVFSPSAVSVFDKPVITLYWNIEKNFKIIKNQLIVNLIVHKHIRGYARYQIDNQLIFINFDSFFYISVQCYYGFVKCWYSRWTENQYGSYGSCHFSSFWMQLKV